MQEIKIYQREIVDGIAEAVRSQASIAYCAPAALVEVDEKESLVDKIIAENKDQMDLYYLESILVSTNWNANDDVFLAGPTWAARHTPEDKPFNFMHDEDDIIGHMTGSYIVDRNGNRVEADSDSSHPDDFDIVTRVVLYKSWANPENAERMVQIIADLEGDEEKWFVSMECLFAGFDYAVMDKSDNRSIIARNEESAFLTRHLKSYGGTGEYDGFRIGRALKNIAFSGQGLVNNPANKGSRILRKNASVAFTSNSNISIAEKTMSDTVTKEQYDVLKVELTEAKDSLKDVQAKMEAAKAKEIADQITAHEAEIADKDSTIADLTEKVSTLETEATEAKDAVKTAEDALAKSKEEVEEMKKKEKEEKRKAALVEAGVEADKASETVSSLDALDDDAFASIVELYASKKAEASSEEDGDADDTSDDDDAAAADALEDTDTEEGALAGDDGDDGDETRKAVAEFIFDAMNIKTDSE